jgi:hypothetical protein
MAIFGILDLEPTVQVDDKTRLSAIQSFISKDESGVTLVEVEPEAASGFIDVTGTSSDDWYLDWSYSGTSSRTETVSLRITTDGAPVTFTKDLQILTAIDDNLFSGDAGILDHETELKSLLPEGKSSFLYVHRKAKQLILDWFNEMGYIDFSAEKLTDAAFVEKEEVRKMSELWTLSLIYKDLSNSVGDKFDQKSIMYSSKLQDSRRRLKYRLDLNGDGNIDAGEFAYGQSFRLSRK